MKKHGYLLREDFFYTDKIREVRAEDDGADILCAYLALNAYADTSGYIDDDSIPEIASELEYDEDELRNLIERILYVELADLGCSGFWLKHPEDFAE